MRNPGAEGIAAARADAARQDILRAIVDRTETQENRYELLLASKNIDEYTTRLLEMFCGDEQALANEGLPGLSNDLGGTELSEFQSKCQVLVERLIQQL